MKKAQFMVTMTLGDTDLDIHGCLDQIEEIYIHDTDIEIFELVHALNWDEFKKRFNEAMYA
jgi:hypothetical protein